MPVTDVTHDIDTRTLTITAEFAAPVERIWQVYADPRQLEQVFGPPTYPATFVDHDLTPGGRANYFMTSPEGERYYGWWQVTAVDEPRSFAFDDGFAVDDTFAPNPDLPLSTSPEASPSTTGSLSTKPSPRTRTCRCRRTITPSRRPTPGRRPSSRAATTRPKPYRRCSRWVWSRAHRRP